MNEIVEDYKADTFEVRNVPGVDPFQVIIQELGLQRGRLTVTCYGEAWTTYWASMPADTVPQFIEKMGVDYLASSLAGGSERYKYIFKIAEVLKRVIPARAALAKAEER